MAIGVIWSPPIDAATYEAIKERVMQGAIDRGCRFHAAGESPSGWRIVCHHASATPAVTEAPVAGPLH